MAELFMECEEEELEPWQKKEETPQEEDDELIFVGAVPGSKSPTSSKHLFSVKQSFNMLFLVENVGLSYMSLLYYKVLDVRGEYSGQ